MSEIRLERIEKSADILIIGGGTAGCYAALTLARNSDLKVIVAEKANVKRSGCLAAGVNALNAYITKGRKPSDYADYAMNDVDGIARYDLLLSMSEGLNKVTEDLEHLGLVILKDKNGEYVARGNRNIKINGENIKPILADAIKNKENIEIINNVNITDYLISSDSDNNSDVRIRGAVGFDVNQNNAYIIHANQVLVATGGAAGLYRPNNPGFSRHKMWYPPFNTGAGYAMGIEAGAEMTTLEMRFIALRCKDTIAPTGTIAQGVGAKQTNSLGEVYESKYGIRTFERVYGTVKENLEGKGPCYLDTTKISKDQEDDLLKAYLNMAPSQTLKWIEDGAGPSKKAVEIEGTEPYIVGGHTASGYWIDNRRRTTIPGLYAAGDVAGGAPQKYVTGALAEGKIAAETIINDRSLNVISASSDKGEISAKADQIINGYETYLSNEGSADSIEKIEEEMQEIMDIYAGGISKAYTYDEESLIEAEKGIREVQFRLRFLRAETMDDLLNIYEIRERLILCHSVILHLFERKETRWNSFAENASHPEKQDSYRLYINSVKKDGKLSTIKRDLILADDENIDFLKERIWN